MEAALGAITGPRVETACFLAQTITRCAGAVMRVRDGYLFPLLARLEPITALLRHVVQARMYGIREHLGEADIDKNLNNSILDLMLAALNSTLMEPHAPC